MVLSFHYMQILLNHAVRTVKPGVVCWAPPCFFKAGVADPDTLVESEEFLKKFGSCFSVESDPF